MKSAYERAMERFGDGDSPALNGEQKASIAEINQKHEAQIAERKTFLEGKIQAALADGQIEEVEALREQLSRDLATIRDDWERAKQKVWDQNPS
jgi:hypothetical protein